MKSIDFALNTVFYPKIVLNSLIVSKNSWNYFTFLISIDYNK